MGAQYLIMKKFLIVSLLILSSFIFSFPVYAQEVGVVDTAGTPTENSEPPKDFVIAKLTNIPGVTDTTPDTFRKFLNSVYAYGVGLAGTLAVLMLMFWGFQYMLSETPFGISESTKRLGEIFLGLILILSPIIIFGIINPQILSFDISLWKSLSLPTDGGNVDLIGLMNKCDEVQASIRNETGVPLKQGATWQNSNQESQCCGIMTRKESAGEMCSVEAVGNGESWCDCSPVEIVVEPHKIEGIVLVLWTQSGIFLPKQYAYAVRPKDRDTKIYNSLSQCQQSYTDIEAILNSLDKDIECGTDSTPPEDRVCTKYFEGYLEDRRDHPEKYEAFKKDGKTDSLKVLCVKAN